MSTVFRWNITRREQLGRLVDGEPAPSASSEPQPSVGEVLRAVRECSARVLARAGDARLVFIGRSPESLYDYLSGALGGTSWARRLTMFNVSFRYRSWDDVEPGARAGLLAQLRSLELDPVSIASAPQPIAFIDLISGGGTFESLFELLFRCAEDERVDLRTVRRKLRVVGITSPCEPNSAPVHWRRLDWAIQFRPSALRGVSVPWWFWAYMGNRERKVSRWNPHSRWGDPEMTRPPRERQHLDAIREARNAFDAGRTRAEREALASELVRQSAVRDVWCRVRAAEIRSGGRARRIERTFASKHRVRSWRRHVHGTSSVRR